MLIATVGIICRRGPSASTSSADGESERLRWKKGL